MQDSLSLFLRSASRDLENSTSDFNWNQTIQSFSDYVDFNQSNVDEVTLQIVKAALQNASENKENILYSENPHFVFTRLKSTYDTILGLEYFLFKPLDDYFSIRKYYPSTSFPVQLSDTSIRLKNKRIMALFPEAWHKTFRINVESMPVYYFINRFLERYSNFTRPLLLDKIDGDVFTPLLKASSNELNICANIWVSLHEYFHSNSVLPLPQYLSHKASKEAEAFEELRVDLNVLSELPKIPTIPRNFLEKVRGYILAERLFHYASNYNPNKDYDAISSQMLFECLKVKGGLQIFKDRVLVNETVWQKIDELKDQFNQIEYYAKGASPKEATQYFTNKARELGKYLPK